MAYSSVLHRRNIDLVCFLSMLKIPLLEALETLCFSFVAGNVGNEIASGNPEGKDPLEI